MAAVVVPLVLTLLLLLLPSHSSSQDRETERRRAVLQVLQQYSDQHGAQVLRTETPPALCARKFVVSSYYGVGCTSMGNRIGGVLSNLLYAVLVNRTFVLTDNEHVRQCRGHLLIKNTFVFKEEILPLLVRSGCPITEVVNFDTLPPCNYSNLPNQAISNDAILNRVFFHAHRDYDPTLQEPSLRRAELLFGHPSAYDLARFEPYGLLFQMLFEFSEDVHRAVNSTLSSITQRNPTKISIHLRHQNPKSMDNPSLDVGLDTRATRVLSKVLRVLHVKGACVVLIATDRNATLHRIEQVALKYGCAPYSINRHKFPHAPDQLAEHGHWPKGLVQLADLLLLTHGDHFIGTLESTYSVLIANLIVSRYFLTKEVSFEPHMRWINESCTSRYFDHPAPVNNCFSGHMIKKLK